MIEKLKGTWRSWTIWFNGLMAVVIPGLPMLQDSFPQLQPFIPGNLYQYLGGVIVAANIVLRFKTNKSLADK